jgi:hypothetical protein
MTNTQRQKYLDRVYELRMTDKNKVPHKWFPFGTSDASKCLNCGRKVSNDEELEEANEGSCEFD